MKYNCVQCGKCCRNLNRKGEMGLLLFPDEIQYFPSSSIEPCLGKGKNPNHKSFKIWAYQLNEIDCPNLCNNICKIYENRRRTCKQFPFLFNSFQNNQIMVQINPDCTSHQNQVRSGEFSDGQKLQDVDEVEYAQSTGRWMLNFQSQKKRHALGV